MAEQTNNYNPKLDYLFCKYASSRKPLKRTDEEEWKKVYKGEITAKDYRQENMLRLKNVLTYVKDSKCAFSLDNVLTCLELYTENHLADVKYDVGVLSQILHYENTIYDINFRDLFVNIIRQKPFDEEINVEMAEIITNLLLIKQNSIPLIFYSYVVDKLLYLINSNELEGAKLLMLNLLARSKRFNRKHKYIPLEDLLKKIEEIKPILHKRFGIKSLFYYGSYAKNTINEYSDFDLYIEVDDEHQEDIDNKFLIKGYLEKELNITIDCHVNDIDYKKYPLRIDMIRHIKQIF